VSDTQLAAQKSGKRKIDGADCKAGKAERQRGGPAETRHLAGGAGKQEEADAREQDQPEADRHPAEDDQLGDLFRIEAPAPVEAVAHRAAAERRDADIVADRKAGEGGERRLPVRERLADIAQRQEIEEGQADIGAGREGERQGEIHLRDRGNGVADILPGILAERPVDQPASDENGAGDGRVENMGPFHAFSFSSRERNENNAFRVPMASGA